MAAHGHMISFAVGDPHGCYEQVLDLIVRCRHHADRRPHRFIFVGDYIDRGPNSRAVVQCLMDLSSSDEHHIFLRGNHEEMLLHALFDPQAEADWIAEGGANTLTSYSARAASDLPADHVRWLTERPLIEDDGLRLFVHAGINPKRALNEQSTTDVLWIREPFLSFEGHYERLIVHGHTPTGDRQPDVRPNRMNIDTGAVFGGPLSAAVFVDGQLAPTAFFHSYA